MKNPLGKTADINAPYAVFKGPAGFEWRVLKSYRLPKNEGIYGAWFVAAKSDMTYGSFEYGDTYISEILEFGNLVEATPEFLNAYSNISFGMQWKDKENELH